MRRSFLAFVLLLSLAPLSCASFRGIPGKDSSVIAVRREYSFHSNRSVTLIVRNEGTMQPYCFLDAGNDFSCDISMEWLEGSAMLSGGSQGWRFLGPQDARNVCAVAMRMTPADDGDIQACAFALMQVRFIDLPPDDRRDQ